MLREFIYKRLEYLGIQKIAFAGLGLDLCANDKNHFFVNPKLFVLSFLGYILTLISMSRFIIYHFNDIDAIAETLILFIDGGMSVVKLILFWFKVPEFFVFKKHSTELYKKMKLKESKHWQNHNQTEQFYSWCYNFLTLCGFAMVFARPFLMALYNYQKMKTFLLNPPIMGIYPWDLGGPFFYLVTIFVNILFSYSIRNAILGVDSIFLWAIFSTSAHFCILKEHLTRTAEKFRNHSDNFQNSQWFTKEMKQIFWFHQKVIKLAADIDFIFRPIIFFQVLIWSIQTCFAIHILQSGDVNFYTQIIMILCVLILLIQVGFYCFGGQKLGNEGEDVAETIDLVTPWEILEPQTRRMFLLFILRSQYPPLLTGYFFRADRILFIRMVRTSFSYTALLQATT